MRVILFGASGMIGQGVLRECLLDPDVEAVLAIGRAPLHEEHAKLRTLVRKDLFDYSDIEEELTDWDACFFCLGVSSTGMTEAQYERVTYDLTMRAAEVLARKSPKLTFVFVSGAGTDSTEQSKTMW